MNEKILAGQQAGKEWAKFYNSIPGLAGGKANEKWIDRKIFSASVGGFVVDLLTDSISEVEEKYDPVLYYTEDRSGILNYPEDNIIMTAWHPGYVDYYVYRLGERINRPKARQWVICRTQDVSALCDIRLKNWIKANRIELVNTRDALYGTSEYQNHLRIIGSDLSIL
jgi:chitin disaccharide deacetylase